MWLEVGRDSPTIASTSNLNIQYVIHMSQLLKIRLCVLGTLHSAHTLGLGVAWQTEKDVYGGERCLQTESGVMVCGGKGVRRGLLWSLQFCGATAG